MKRFEIVALALGVSALVIALASRDPAPALFFSLIWSFALAFIQPGRAWLSGLALAAWAPLVALTHALPAQPNGWPWCSHGMVEMWQIALVVAAAVAIFTAVGALAALSLTYVLAHGPWRDVPALRYVKPALDVGGSTLGILLVGYAVVALGQPLQPYAPGERYCWDEYCFRVDSISRVKTLGDGANRIAARGTFYVVNATLDAPWWGRIEWSPAAVYVVGRQGESIEYSLDAQRIVDGKAGRSSACHVVRGASERETMVFDLPDEILQPRLLVRDTLGFSGLLGSARLGRLYVRPAFNLRYD